MNKPYLSVIIPVFNDAFNLQLLLESIFENSFKDIEVIVIDDCSTDLRVQEVTKSFKIRYYKHSVNRCVAAARNTGAKQAKADILVFFDSDIIIGKNLLQSFSDAYKNGNISYFQGVTSKVPSNRGFGSELTALRWHFETLQTKSITIYSMCFSVKKDIFFKVGGFDERFQGLGAEEFEFAQRVKKETPIHTDPTLLVRHNFQTSIPRTLALFKRTIRYSLMFIFRTRTLDTQVGRLEEILSSMFALLSFLAFSVSPLSNMKFIAFKSGGFLFALHLLINLKFYLYILKEKGIFFSLKAVPVYFMWALAIGFGIFLSMVIAAYMVLTGKRYGARLISEAVKQEAAN